MVPLVPDAFPIKVCHIVVKQGLLLLMIHNVAWMYIGCSATRSSSEIRFCKSSILPQFMIQGHLYRARPRKCLLGLTLGRRQGQRWANRESLNKPFCWEPWTHGNLPRKHGLSKKVSWFCANPLPTQNTPWWWLVHGDMQAYSMVFAPKRSLVDFWLWREAGKVSYPDTTLLIRRNICWRINGTHWRPAGLFYLI